MPTEVRCKECGFLFASWPELPPDDWFHKIYMKYNGKCPKCGHPLPKYTNQAIQKMEVKVIPLRGRGARRLP